MIRIVLLLFAAVVWCFSLAAADTRDVYTVKGIPVDERAPNVIEAQQTAFATARRLAAQALIEKLTLPEDVAALGGLAITQELADQLAAAVDVDEETRGGGRYIGELSVVMNPGAVRAFLDRQGLAYLDRQAPKAMIVPVGDGRSNMAWMSAWPDADESALAPFITSQNPLPFADATWNDLQTDIALLGAERVVLARLQGFPGNYTVALTVLTPAGREAIGNSMPAADLEGAVLESARLLNDVWKREAMVRSDERTIVTANVLYTSIAEWGTLRGALARSPLVSDFQTQAIARDGALVKFAYAGDEDRLARDLRQRGVAMDADTTIWILSSAVSAVQ